MVIQPLMLLYWAHPLHRLFNVFKIVPVDVLVIQGEYFIKGTFIPRCRNLLFDQSE